MLEAIEGLKDAQGLFGLPMLTPALSAWFQRLSVSQKVVAALGTLGKSSRKQILGRENLNHV